MLLQGVTIALDALRTGVDARRARDASDSVMPEPNEVFCGKHTAAPIIHDDVVCGYVFEFPVDDDQRQVLREETPEVLYAVTRADEDDAVYLLFNEDA